ncbi:MAG: hypothetical protein JNM10_17395 [Planctomycetia bacterium]|nr:hypothetical protein [Planctomycetia bacterium]
MRFRYTKGLKQALILESTLGSESARRVAPTTTTTDLTLEVTDVAADGSATIDGVTGGMTMSGGLAGASAGLATLRTRTHLRMSPRGEILASEVHVDAADVAPALRSALTAIEAGVKESLDQLGVVWPEEPVGPGARWVFRRKMATGVADADVIVETTLVARDGDRLTLSSRMKVAMGAQDVQAPGGGRTLRLKSLTGHGTMDQTSRLTSLAQTLDLKMAMVIELELDVPDREGKPMRVPQTLDYTTTQRIRPKE